MEIKVMGPGCPSCKKAEEIVREAVAESGREATIEKVSDFADIAKAGVLSTPAVVIDGQVKCVGKVPDKKDLLEWLK